MTRKILTGLVLAALAVFAAAFAAAPVVAAQKLIRAAQAGDPAAIARHVDFPAFRESLKVELNGRLMAEMRRDGGAEAAALSGLGMILGPSLISSAVDTLVTPEAVAVMVRTARTPTPAEAVSPPPPDRDGPDLHQSWGYRDFNAFAVTLTDPDRPYQPLALILERRGVFSWKLAGIELPPG